MATTTYTIRSIDLALWRKARSRAAAEGVPMRTVLLQLLKAYAEGAKLKA